MHSYSKEKLTNQMRNVTMAGHSYIILQVLPMHANSSFIKVSPLLLNGVRSLIFVHDVVHTAHCFPDKLLIFTRPRHHDYLVNRFSSDINYSVASLKALESLSDEWNCVLLALFSFYAYEPARILLNIIISMYLIVRKCEVEPSSFGCYKRKRTPMFP